MTQPKTEKASEQLEVLERPQWQQNQSGHHNEAYEHETSATGSSSGSSSVAEDQYDEKEATIEFSSIASNFDSFGPTSQLSRNLAGSAKPALPCQQQEKANDLPSSLENETIEIGSYGGDEEPATGASESNGFVISWSDLDYVVESKWYKLTPQRKPILKNLSGSFRSGELSAVLGPSGAGKSTLIDCLLGKRDRGVTGRTRVTFGSGHLEEERRSRKPLKIATIPQEDHLLDTLTVTETFMFASRIKNAHLIYADDEGVEMGSRNNSGEVKGITGRIMNAKGRKPFDHFANVRRVIQQLNLSACAQLKCGKLSGGQYKRVSIGQELLSRPDLMILDEPTSGLDSVTCFQTIGALRQLIDSSGYPMAIVATIHQPDIEVFNLFHKAYVLASGGRAIYEGPTNAIFRTLNLGLELVEARRHQWQPPPTTAARGEPTKLQGQLVVASNQLTTAPTATNSGESQQLNGLRVQLNQPPGLAGNPARLIVEVAAGEYGFEITGAMTELQSRAHRTTNRGNGELQSVTFEGGASADANEHPAAERPRAPKFDYQAHNPAHRRAQLDRLLDATKTTNCHRSLRVYLRHLSLHTSRSWITIVRDPMLFSLQLLLHVLVPLLISYSFMNQEGHDACPRVGPLDVIDEAYRAGNVLDELNVEIRAAFENLGYMFFQLYVIIFAAVCVTSLTYPLVMHVLLKEYRNGWYSMSSYFLGRTLADLPVPTVNVVIAMAISYHLTGQPLSPYHWRFVSVALLTVLATLVAQTQGLMFGAMLMNLPQSAVFVAPASTAPLVVVSGFLLRIKLLPLPLQFLSQLSYFTHLLNGFVVSRYGFNRCPCDEEQFKVDLSHQIPPQTRGIMDIWVESFGTEYLQGENNSTAAADISPPQVDLIGKLVDTVTRAKTFGFEINDCSQVKPFAMLDYDLNDWDLTTCFVALVVMLFGFRLLTYMVLSWKINNCI